MDTHSPGKEQENYNDAVHKQPWHSSAHRVDHRFAHSQDREMGKHLDDPKREEYAADSQTQSVHLLNGDKNMKRYILRGVSHIKLPVRLEGEFHVFGYNGYHHRSDIDDLQEVCDSADPQLKFKQDLGHVKEAMEEDEGVED